MARKRYETLMSGIMGNETKQEETPEVISSDETNEAKVETSTKKPVGRPRKENKKDAESEIRTTIISDRLTMRKLKYIAFMDDCLLKDVIDQALESYIQRWEKENGEIPKPKK